LNIRVTEKTEDAGWLVLIYRVPPEPTRLRSTVWRRIKSLGAIYLQNSAAALPASAATERALRKLRREIIDMSGTAVLLSCSVLAGESDVHKAFQAARNDEYEEIVDRCEDFLQQARGLCRPGVCRGSGEPLTASPAPSPSRPLRDATVVSL
jgi:Protein ChrB, N-terminal